MSKGHTRERQFRKRLEDEGWWTCRAAGSLGDADLVACRPDTKGAAVRLVEVKANAGSPFMHFRPADRKRLLEAAEKAGGEAVLIHWPPRSQPTAYTPEMWPRERRP